MFVQLCTILPRCMAPLDVILNFVNPTFELLINLLLILSDHILVPTSRSVSMKSKTRLMLDLWPNTSSSCNNNNNSCDNKQQQQRTKVAITKNSHCNHSSNTNDNNSCDNKQQQQTTKVAITKNSHCHHSSNTNDNNSYNNKQLKVDSSCNNKQQN